MAGHGHSHQCCSHSENKNENLESLYSLYTKIDLQRSQCLNEKLENSFEKVFRQWEDRLNKEIYVESDVDEELLFNIQFTGDVKLSGVIVIGGADGSHPSQMRLFKNRVQMTFDDTSCDPEQDFELHEDPSGVLEYKTKLSKFSGVSHLSMHFPHNFGAQATIIHYIGLRGTFTESQRHGVTICTYEARANPADHKTQSFNHVSHQIQ